MLIKIDLTFRAFLILHHVYLLSIQNSMNFLEKRPAYSYIQSLKQCKVDLRALVWKLVELDISSYTAINFVSKIQISPA